MARNDDSERSGPAREAADGPADDLQALLDELACRITDADERHSDTVHDMQARLTTLADRAAVAKPDVPDHCAETFERVEGAIVALADRLTQSKSAKRRSSPAFDHADFDQSELPNEVQAEVRRAIFDAHQASAVIPPAQRATPSGDGGGRLPAMPHETAAGRRPFGESGEATSPSAAPSNAWGQETLDALARSYERPPAPAPVTAGAAPGIDRSWLEERFADIAGRVEQSLASLNPHNAFLTIGARFDQLEQRFDTALDHMTTRVGADLEALRSVEKQIGDLVAQFDRTQTQLGRLDHIERRLSELRQSLSEEQMKRLVGALSPSDQALSAVAMAAAERVAEQIRAQHVANAAPAEPDPRLGELTTLLQEFIGEQRRGDVGTAEALDTMQLAMQHLIDRVEAIETLHVETRDAFVSAAPATPERRNVQPSNVPPSPGPCAPHPAPAAEIAEPPTAKGVVIDGVRIVVTSGGMDGDSSAEGGVSAEPWMDTPQASPARAGGQSAESRGARPNSPTPSSDVDRDALIAMARRAADRASSATPPATRTTAADSPAAATAGKSQPASRLASAMAAVPARRPGFLLVASFAAFLLAGFWMVAGTGLRGVLPGAGQPPGSAPSSTPASGNTAPASDGAHALPRGQQQGSLPPGNAASRPPQAANGFPGTGRVVDGGVGITVDETPRATDPAAMLKVREQLQMASLSARVGEDHAQQSALPPTPSTSDMLAAVGRRADGPETGLEPRSAMSRSVEIPPAMIGPLSLRHAAANGDAAAQFEVASRFAEAKGVPQDFAQAATWYQRAAVQGFANAQYRLGGLYERGLGVAADPARARVWYSRAAAQGNVRAMHNLAVLSAGRIGGSPDYPSAVQWFTEAANRGLADSQYNLGILYESGLGVPASNIEAYKWYALAARSGDRDAVRRRDIVRGKLDSASFKSADALVIGWRAKPADAPAN